MNEKKVIPEKGKTGSSSGVKQLAFNSSGQGDISNFSVPERLFNFFKMEHGRFRSCRNLYRSSSRSLSDS